MGFPFTTAEVLSLLGYTIDSYKSGVYIQCPFCRSKNKPLHFELMTSKYRCNKNPEHYGNILTFYREIEGCKDNKEAYKEILKRLNINDVSNTREVILPKTNKEIQQDLDKSNRVYQQLLAKSYLSKSNREDLLNRGFSDVDIQRVGYKTLPQRNGKEIYEFTKSLDLKDPAGVPGFFLTKRDYWILYHGKSGIMIPYLSFFGKVQAIQIRKDESVREFNPETGEKEHKFYYLSSRYKKCGTPARQVVHYAGQFLKKDGGRTLQVSNGILVYLEGAMKGDLFYSLTGQPAMCFPGVNCLEVLKQELPVLKEQGIHTLLNGYDMDFIYNINVLEASLKTEKLILDHGFNYQRLTWDTTYIDSQGKENKLNINTMFVFTVQTLIKAIEEDNLSLILKRAKVCKRTRIMFALKDQSELTQKNQKLNSILRQKCKELGFIECKTIFWHLRRKGIDDYYAFKLKGIERTY